MSSNTTIDLGEYYENIIQDQLKLGKFDSSSEVIRAALRLFEIHESRNDRLIRELRKGEDSGYDAHFDREQFVADLHKKYS